MSHGTRYFLQCTEKYSPAHQNPAQNKYPPSHPPYPNLQLCIPPPPLDPLHSSLPFHSLANIESKE